MLEIDVRKRLRDFSLDVQIDVPKGEILMLVGDNGCGKTTILNLIAGISSPDWGRISLNGKTLFNSEIRADAAPEERNIGYVFQSYALFPHMSVYDNVAFGLRARGLSAAEIELMVRDRLDEAGLWEIRKAKASSISGGQKQRVALARALIIEPELLLLDEPAAGMNPQEIGALMEFIHWIRDEFHLTIWLIEHQMRLVMNICERIKVLDFGATIADGTPEEIRHNPKVIEAYLGEQAEVH